MKPGNTVADGDELRRRAALVRDRISLSSVIGRDVKLQKRGAEYVGLCPFHHDTRIGSFTVNDGKAIYHCFACQANGDHFTYLKERKGTEFIAALKMFEANAGIDFTDAKQRVEFDRHREKREREEADKAEKRRLNAWGLWNHAARMADTPAKWYLETRGIDFAMIGRFPGAIRFEHDCYNAELKRGIPAMVTAMTRLDGTFAATHRTYLELVRGRWVKARLDQPKMVLGAFGGSHMALHKGASGKMKLAEVPAGTVPHISEGIEDALTIAMAFPELRILGAATLGNIGDLELPPQVSQICLIGQNDDEVRNLRAIEAARAGDLALAERHEKALMEIKRASEAGIAKHQAQGRAVECMWPDPGFKDFNDQLRGVRIGTA